jgi:hypothetical protein
MIKRRTLFILGAGASIPYGFPSGAELRALLCDAAGAIDSELSRLLFGVLEINTRDTFEFAQTFLNSGQPSIDAFLARRGEFREIGKLCIAAALCQREVPARVMRYENDDNWYALLWEALTRDTTKASEVSENNARFVTFNYDRSLEHFLFQATKNTFPDVSDAQALAVVNSLGILHIYGSLGKFHYPDQPMGTRRFEPNVKAPFLQIAAHGLSIIPEARDDAPVFHEAQKLIIWCEALCFLGFGFDFLNLARLNVPGALKDRSGRPPLIVASAFEKTNAELGAYYRRVCEGQKWTTFNTKNSMTLRESGVLFE